MRKIAWRVAVVALNAGGITAAMSQDEAVSIAVIEAGKAGHSVTPDEVEVARAPEFDRWAEKQPEDLVVSEEILIPNKL